MRRLLEMRKLFPSAFLHPLQTIRFFGATEMLSILDILSVGNGPSSSPTVGPMQIGAGFSRNVRLRNVEFDHIEAVFR